MNRDFPQFLVVFTKFFLVVLGKIHNCADFFHTENEGRAAFFMQLPSQIDINLVLHSRDGDFEGTLLKSSDSGQ